MKSLRFWDRRAGYSLASVGMLLGMVAPAAIPALTSAAQVASRSIAMSSSAVSATGVSYEVKFTAETNGTNAFVLDFCDDSPIVGQTCTAPSGFDISGATLTSGAATVSNFSSGSVKNELEVTLSSAANAGDPVDVVLGGITNPNYTTATGAHTGFFARILTYDTEAHAQAYASPIVDSHVLDNGGVALAITSTIGVTATVRETMTFCVAGTSTSPLAHTGSGPTGNCGADNQDGTTGASGLDSNHVGLTLGHGTPAALDSSAADVGYDWAQISTNASTGASVSMTNTNSGGCSGLFRTGGTVGTCDIAGAGNSAAAITGGLAKFGLNLGSQVSAPNSVATPTGTLAPLAPYSTSSQYGMGTGVTGTYGDPIFNTSGAPIANKNVLLTFAASAAPTTPAGVYTATMNLIATGTY